MRRVVADKIASVAQSCGLTPELRLSGEVPCEEGVVLAVEILNDKYTYSELELAGGRNATVQAKCSSVRPGSVPNTLQAGGSLLGDIVQQQFEVRAAVGT